MKMSGKPGQGLIEDVVELGCTRSPGMSGAESMSAALDREKTRLFSVAGTFERLCFPNGHRLIVHAMDDQPGNVDPFGGRTYVEPIGVLLDVVQHVGVERKYLAGPGILYLQMTTAAPVGTLIGRPALDP